MRKLGWFSLGFGAALALYAWLARSIWGFAAGALFALLLLKKRGWRCGALAALGLAVGFCWFSAYDLWITAPVRALAGQTLHFQAVARDDPQASDYGTRVCADAVAEGRRFRVLLYDSDPLEIRPGDRLTVTASLRTPGDGDYDIYCRSIGVDLIGICTRGSLYAAPAEPGLRTLPLRLRRWLKEQIRTIFPADSAPFITALLTGDRSGLRYADTNAMSVAGISHIVAISGMHVAILLGLILLLCAKRRWLSALIGVPVVAVFAVMTGATPSVVRASVMQIIWLLAPLFRREDDPPTSLGAAALCVLAPNPWAVTNLSFQLSFGAMAGIVLLSGRLYRRIGDMEPIRRALRSRYLRGPVHYFVGALISTCSASVFTLPLIALRMGTISLVALATNLLTLWAVALLFKLSLALCLLGAVWMLPARFLAPVAAIAVRYILGVARFMASVPASAVYTENPFILPWLIFAYLAAGCCLLPEGRRLILPAACVAALTLCLCVWLGYLDGGAHTLQMTMLDVGQGQCLIFQDGGATVIYDCGGSGGERVGEDCARTLLSRGTGRVDILILSHYDLDHAGGVCQLLARLPVGRIYLPDLPCDNGLREAIEQSANDCGTQIVYVREDEKLSFSSSTAYVFAPVTQESDNESSLALLVSQGGFDILATGDMNAAAERLLLSRRRLPDVEVLVAGHHGSASSTCDTLLALTRPETVLISVGAHNSYGHPASETTVRIESTGAQLLRTDLCGNITIRR